MDYSKWDRWADEQSDSDEQDDRGEPVVTKFDGPASVTFGKGETVAEVGRPPASAAAASAAAAAAAARAPSLPHARRAADDSPVEIVEVPNASPAVAATQGLGRGAGVSSRAPGSTPATTSSTSTSSRSSSNAARRAPSYTQNGGITPTHYWSQTKDRCVVYLFVPPGTRGRDATVALTDTALTVSVVDKSSGAARRGAAKPTAATPGRLVLGGQLANEVVAPKEADDIDWDIIDDTGGDGGSGAPAPRRLLRVELEKRSVAAGVVHWWSRVFEGDAEIDVTRIGGRKAGASVAQFQENWKKAHEMFRAKVKGIVKQEVHYDDSDEEEEGDDDEVEDEEDEKNGGGEQAQEVTGGE